MPWLAVAATVAGGVLGIASGRKKKKAAIARQKINKLRNFQARRAFLNTFLQAQGQALNQAAQTGADLGSSAAQGQLASNLTQTAVGLGETDVIGRLDAYAAKKDQQADSLAGYANLLQGVGSAINTYSANAPRDPKVVPTDPEVTNKGPLDG